MSTNPGAGQTDPAPSYGDKTESPNGGDASTEEESESVSASSVAFAYEQDLKNYLVRNLEKLESGLRVYQEEEISGVEFPVGGRYIDILATDKSNNLVVIELKVSRGYDRTMGQLLRYIAWIKKNLAADKKVRGIIIANEITEDLRMAASMVPDVQVAEYKIDFTLSPLEKKL